MTAQWHWLLSSASVQHRSQDLEKSKSTTGYNRKDILGKEKCLRNVEDVGDVCILVFHNFIRTGQKHLNGQNFWLDRVQFDFVP